MINRNRIRGLLAGAWALGMLTATGPVSAGGVINVPELRPVISGLDRPVAVRHADDGSGRLFVVQRDGLIRVFSGGQVLTTPFLDVTGLTATNTNSNTDERGLLGLAFHPDYSNNGRLFIYYTDNSSDTVVAEYAVSAGDPNVANPAATILLQIDQDFGNHNGGDLHFGPDGYLYIGMGDGGSANDPCDRAQTLDPADLAGGGSCAPDGGFGGNDDSRALLGKMLRIDIDNTTAAGANELCAGDSGTGAALYAIPNDNPFAGADPSGACDEVWAYGLRNPYRFSFDRTNGDLWISDVGQNAREEVNLQAAASLGGEDYGWRICEGNSTNGDCPDGSGRTPPLFDYLQSGGRCAVTGGFLYRGPVSRFQGSYLFGDYCTGEILEATDSGMGWSFTVLFDPDTDPSGFCDSGLCLSGFGEDEVGNLYATDLIAGTVYQITIDDLLFSNGFE